MFSRSFLPGFLTNFEEGLGKKIFKIKNFGYQFKGLGVVFQNQFLFFVNLLWCWSCKSFKILGVEIDVCYLPSASIIYHQGLRSIFIFQVKIRRIPELKRIHQVAPVATHLLCKFEHLVFSFAKVIFVQSSMPVTFLP